MLTVAVTGPTGDIGRALLRELDADPAVDRVLGMARRQFDPGSMGLTKTEYRQGDVLDREAVDALVADADVLVHLAFIILGGRDETRSINLEGSRNVFEAARGVQAARLHVVGRRVRLPRRQPAAADRGRPRRAAPTSTTTRRRRRSSRQTLHEALDGADVETYVFRPCIVAGGDALALVEAFPTLLRKVPLAKPVLPDPGTPFQLVHTDDVASALAAAVRGDGAPGVYNLAGDGTITVGDLARAFGWLSVPVPQAGVALTAGAVDLLPFMPASASWINAFRVPVVMDTAQAREQLGWEPLYDTRAVLEDTVSSARDAGLL